MQIDISMWSAEIDTHKFRMLGPVWPQQAEHTVWVRAAGPKMAKLPLLKKNRRNDEI